MQNQIINCFVTGQWNADEDMKTLLQNDQNARKELELTKSYKHALASSNHVEYSDRLSDQHSLLKSNAYSNDEDEDSDESDGADSDFFENSGSNTDLEDDLLDKDDQNKEDTDPYADYDKVF